MKNPEDKPSLVQRILVWLAGADIACLQQCPRWERVKYEAFGASVLVPVALGIISSAYAVSTLTDNIYMIVCVSLVLGGIILSIDRVLLSTYRAYDKLFKRFLQFVARLLVAVVLGIAVAYPLSLLLFKQSIHDQVRSERNSEVEAVRLAAESENFESQNKITESSNRLEDLQREYQRTLTKDFSESITSNYEQTFSSIDSQLESLKVKRVDLNRQNTATETNSGQGLQRQRQIGELTRVNTMISDLTSRRIRLSLEFLNENLSKTSASSHNLALLAAIQRQIDSEGSILKRLSFDAEQRSIQTGSSIAELQGRGSVDILAQTFALQAILSKPQKGGQFTLWVFITIVILFTFFDTLPMLVRFFSVPGPYDMLLHMEGSKYDMCYENRSKEELLELKEKGEIFREQMELRMSLFRTLDTCWNENILQLPEHQTRVIEEQEPIEIETEVVTVQHMHQTEQREDLNTIDIEPEQELTNHVVLQTVHQPIVKRKRRKKRLGRPLYRNSPVPTKQLA